MCQRGVWLYVAFLFLFLSLFTFVRILLLFYFRFFFFGGVAGEWECNGIGCGWVSFLYGDICCQIELYRAAVALPCYDKKMYLQGDYSDGQESQLRGCESIIHFLLDIIIFMKAPNMIYNDICSYLRGVWQYVFIFIFVLSLFTFVRILLLFYFYFWVLLGNGNAMGLGGGVSILCGDVCCQIELYRPAVALA